MQFFSSHFSDFISLNFPIIFIYYFVLMQALETTSIKTGGRRRDPHAIKMARRSVASSAKARSKSRRDEKRHRKTSLFRKLSSKKATAEMQMLSGSQSLNSLSPANPILRHSTSTPDPNHSDSSSPAGKCLTF